MVIFDKTWWIEHGSTYKSEVEAGEHGPLTAYKAQEENLINVLSRLSKWDSIIEIGAGYGRVTKIISDTFKPKEYLATDVSFNALDALNEYLEHSELVKRQVLDLDYVDPDHYERDYDLVLAVEVLMHRTPEQAKVDISNLLSFSSQYVVLIDWYDPTFKGESPGCYMHQWNTYFTDGPDPILIPEARQAIWVFKKDNAGG